MPTVYLENYCRICGSILSIGAKVNLFSLDKTLLHKIFKILPYEISLEDKLSKNSCFKCVNTLKDFVSFLDKSCSIQKTFKRKQVTEENKQSRTDEEDSNVKESNKDISDSDRDTGQNVCGGEDEDSSSSKDSIFSAETQIIFNEKPNENEKKICAIPNTNLSVATEQESSQTSCSTADNQLSSQESNIDLMETQVISNEVSNEKGEKISVIPNTNQESNITESELLHKLGVTDEQKPTVETCVKSVPLHESDDNSGSILSDRDSKSLNFSEPTKDDKKKILMKKRFKAKNPFIFTRRKKSKPNQSNSEDQENQVKIIWKFVENGEVKNIQGPNSKKRDHMIITRIPNFGLFYSCQKCESGFTSETSAINHNCHAPNRNRESSGDYQCEICHQTFPRRAKLENHVKTHNFSDDGTSEEEGKKHVSSSTSSSDEEIRDLLESSSDTDFNVCDDESEDESAGGGRKRKTKRVSRPRKRRISFIVSDSEEIV